MTKLIARIPWALRMLTLCGLALVASCGDEGGSRPSKILPTLSDPLSQWAFRIYVGDPKQPDKLQLVKLRPVRELSFPGTEQQAGKTMPAEVKPPSKPNGVVQVGDASVDFNEDDLGAATGWALVYGAAAECGMINETSAPDGLPVNPYVCQQTPVVPPWHNSVPPPSTPVWGIFESKPTTCEQSLAYSETLVCIASELARVADSLTPITWSRVDMLTALDGFPDGPWIIPPQSQKDRFIAKDLAIYMLANLALNDGWYTGIGSATKPCSEAYAKAGKDPTTYGWTNRSWIFGGNNSYYWPPTGAVTTGSIPAIAAGRLNAITHILRTGSRLLDDLIDSSVEADMAGAEMRRAHATDEERGSEVAWGRRDNENGKYNTLAHALRVIAGRWELGSHLGGDTAATFYKVDPMCGGVATASLLDDAYGADLTARLSDRSVRTPGQKAAIDIIQSAGIVVPPGVVASNLSGVRAAIKNQLVESAAVANGYALTGQEFTTFTTTGQGKSIEYVLKDISDGDLTFALNKSFNQYRILTSKNEQVTDVTTPGAGLSNASHVASTLSDAAIKGTALAGGIPKQDFGTDFMSRIGRIQVAGQCDEYGGFFGSAGAADNIRVDAFQDAYSIGQTLYRRLVALREETQSTWGAFSPPTEFDAPSRLAEGAATEVRAWTGPGRMFASSLLDDRDPPLVKEINLVLMGFEKEDFGTSLVSEMPDQIALVWGEPWVADCAARLRSNCPANFEADYVRKEKTVIGVQQSTSADQRDLGFDGAFMWLKFEPIVGPQPNFHPEQIGNGNSEKNLYVILLNDPKSPTKKGKVLGALALRNDTPMGATSVPVVFKQQAHFDHIFGPPPKYLEPIQIGQPGMFSPPDYCIDGVPKDFFVPLENELTSDSDEYESSWRHYLSLAKQAAQHADELGREVIELGLQQEYRAEAANEELAQICGDYGAAGKFDTTDGELTPPADDQNLKDCIGEDVYDIVFLTNDPTADKGSQQDQLDFIQDELVECPAGDTSDVCLANGVNNPQATKNIETAGLKLAEYQAPNSPPSSGSCDGVVGLMDSLKSAFDGNSLKLESGAPYLNSGQLQAFATQLHVELFADATTQGVAWTLGYLGAVKMSSALGTLWPGCRRSGAPACADPNEAAVFDKLFRRLTASTGTQLGNGVGSSSAEAEASAILWRIQGALWTIGALAGKIPEGMFTSLIPAVDFNATGWNSVPEDRAPVFTVFGTGRFTGGELDPSGNGVYDPDRDIIGGASAISSNFADAWPAGTDETPEWLAFLYLSTITDKYVHVKGANSEIANFNATGGSVGNWLNQQANVFMSAKCQDSATGAVKLVGTPNNKQAGDGYNSENPMLDPVKALRAGQSWGKLCQSGAGTTFLTLDMIDAKNGIAKSSFKDVLSFTQAPYQFTTLENAKGLVPPATKFPLGSLDLLDTSVPPYGYATVLLDSGASGYETQPQGGEDCSHPRLVGLTEQSSGQPGIQFVYAPCAYDALEDPNGVLDPHFGIRYTRRALLPQSCSQHQRVQAFVNSYPPRGACSAIAQVTQAVGLTCQLTKGGAEVPLTQPDLKSLADLPGFVKWIDRLSVEASRQVSKLYLEKLPKKVVDDFSALKVGSGNLKGDHGVLLLELRSALETMDSSWNRVSGDLAQIRDAVDGARLAIHAAKIAEDTALAQLAIQRMSIHAGMVGAASGVLNVFSGNFGSVVSAPPTMAFSEMMLEKTEELAEYADDDKNNAVAIAINNLQLTSGPVYTDLENALNDVRSSAATVHGIQVKLAQSQEKAKYTAAKAANADYYVDADGQTIKLPVNTVQRRLYDLAQKRYVRALKDAKYLAYVARLAIEQRIGMRLNTIQTGVGVLEAPAYWADDICSLSGVDFEALKEFDTGFWADINNDAAEENDKFVGDYVTKLENFVEYYNIEYPSHDGDDTTVLSVRDDLLGPSLACTALAPNLLYYSGDLTGYDFIDEGAGPVKRGWDTNTCGYGDPKCLQVDVQATVPNPPPLPPEAMTGGFTWLHEVTQSAPDAGADAGEAGAPSSTNPTPPRTVAQVVTLTAGSSYVVSWWDQARASDGNYATTDSPDYVVEVIAPNGITVASYIGKPFRPEVTDAGVPQVNDAGAPVNQIWSERHDELSFQADQSGEYRVVFGAASSPDPSLLGSVLIANVQLEQAPGGSVPSGYIHTTSSRIYVTAECAGKSPEDLQGAFRHDCDKEGKCFYELTTPIVIDTSKVDFSKLAGKLASGNFNFRHIDLAVNLVGTGVYDCTANPSQSCFASAYVEYTLDHDAFQVGVLGHIPGMFQTFNFGSAGINHAKALAAERYITLPIASEDQGLLFQPGVLKPEYRGRPLDGSYRLRIWDSPFLVWNRLEDIQLVLKYRYWSRIEPQPSQ